VFSSAWRAETVAPPRARRVAAFLPVFEAGAAAPSPAFRETFFAAFFVAAPPTFFAAPAFFAEGAAFFAEGAAFCPGTAFFAAAPELLLAGPAAPPAFLAVSAVLAVLAVLAVFVVFSVVFFAGAFAGAACLLERGVFPPVRAAFPVAAFGFAPA